MGRLGKTRYKLLTLFYYPLIVLIDIDLRYPGAGITPHPQRRHNGRCLAKAQDDDYPFDTAGWLSGYIEWVAVDLSPYCHHHVINIVPTAA
jgi:hypothetical protein